VKKRLSKLLTAGIFISFFLANSIQADTSDTTSNKLLSGEQKSADSNPVKYTILTENFPPFTYIENGKLTGISTEIVHEILNRLDMKNIPIKVMPWDEAYEIALKKNDTIIFSVTKIKARENLFKWVGPIATNYWYLFSKKSPDPEKKPISLKNLSESKKYSIGVQDKGAIYLYLKDKGFTNLVKTVSNKGSAENLLNGKIQLWGESELPAQSLLKQMNKKPDILQRAFRLRKHNLYIGFNIKSSDSLVEKFQSTLDQMKNDGTYDKIVNKYYQ